MTQGSWAKADGFIVKTIKDSFLCEMLRTTPMSVGKRWSCRLLLLVVVLTFGGHLRADSVPGGTTTPKILNSLEGLWGLSPAEKAATYPFDVEVHVDYYDRDWKLLWISSPGSATYIPLGAGPLSLKSGQRVRIQGEVTPDQGLSANRIKVTVLSDNEVIEPVPLENTVSSVQRSNAHRVIFHGFVNGAAEP